MQVQCVPFSVPLVLNMVAYCLLPFLFYMGAFTIGYYAYVCQCRCRCLHVYCACAVAGVQVQLHVCTLFSCGHLTFCTLYGDIYIYIYILFSGVFEYCMIKYVQWG